MMHGQKNIKSAYYVTLRCVCGGKGECVSHVVTFE